MCPGGVGTSTGGQLLPSLPPLGVNLQPQLASVTFATNNPTLTTVALEKPLCMFDSSAALDGPCEVYLYVLVDLGKASSSPGGTEGGSDLSAGRGTGGRFSTVMQPPPCPSLAHTRVGCVPAVGGELQPHVRTRPREGHPVWQRDKGSTSH